MQVLLRLATLDDAPLIAELTRGAWSERVAASSSGHRESAQQVSEHLQLGGGFILLNGEDAIGSVRWLPLESEASVWQILRMGVLPQWRGQQLSQHLLEAVIHQAQASHIEELRLAVRHDQPRLLDLYAAHGFELALELEYAQANPAEPAPSVMRRMLRR